ncbi:hypothetical protein DFJ43DRAFT_1153423 [Lentinula guzmanii]|uniref:Uncharacterized protein n=1 Tax=Lentinula guzmanii TaxID=2804957 RepID=A0AA38JEG0_9AGAR|nr:hypothetical protein DFJ43DRAFT_1153423 [Lentinula guzmanii]
MLIPSTQGNASFADAVTNINYLLPALRSPTYVDATSSKSCDSSGSPRTVLGILWSCMAVLFACTWVAVHPNVPRPNQIHWWKSTKKRIGFMILTLVAPEATLWIAVRQWLAARELVKRYRNEGWTMTHAHFALMGGFTLRLTEQNEVVTALKLLSLPKDARVYHRYDLPDDFDIVEFVGQFDEDEIQDRSHSDGLTKVIAIGQTGWFIIQLAARWVQKLPFTELEVMTVAFATINVMAYIFWFKKPLGVQYPIRVQAVWSQSYRRKESPSKSPSQSRVSIRPPRSFTTDELNNELNFGGSHESQSAEVSYGDDDNINVHHELRGSSTPGPLPLDARAGEIVPLMDIVSTAGNEPAHISDRSPSTHNGVQSGLRYTLSRGWSSVFEVDFDTTHPLLKIFFFPFFIVFLPIRVVFSYFLVLSRVEDNSSEEVLYQDEEDAMEKIERLLKGSDLKLKIYRISLFIPCAVAAVFGLIHWIGWLSTFPTKIEEIMWRISSIVVTFIPVHVELAYEAYAERHDILLTAPNFLKYVFAIVWFIAPLAYILARCVLIVQSFLTLRDLPCGALQNIQWTDYLPHI